MRHAKEFKRGSRGKAALFFLVLFGFGVLSMMLPLRPTKSDMEKRELTEFPEFSVQSLASGEFTKGIDTWFADTFPLRDVFFQVNGWVQSFYGVKTVIITAPVEQGDEIPDAPFTGD
ncbi:MAG: DHHW family protein [Acutalibacter sp.]|jgi:hypothetical protein